MATQTEYIVTKLRELLMTGEFEAGQRMQEKHIAERLDTSRTPVKLALTELANEGLLEYTPNRGFVVRRFSIKHIMVAVDVRETLEGMAARLAAHNGISREMNSDLKGYLLQVDGLLLKEELDYSDALMFADINGKFHNAIIKAADNEVLCEMMQKFESIPLAAAKSIAATTRDFQSIRAVIERAQQDHKWVYEAIVARDSVRAENALKQHIHNARQNLERVLTSLQENSEEIERYPFLRLVKD
ncbi:GntR family transcriptional regulator [Henriciella sp. AS95]|uniref:GntR family transcriptional regulator n=1 Tax=Henriciella sp. AS95 TaxID=3135782 RepID=UPI0031823380